jgi:hypothetical protein
MESPNMNKSTLSKAPILYNFNHAIINYSEYGFRALRQYLAGLADHEVFICRITVPCRFHVIVETRVEDYPKKIDQKR